MTQVTPPGWYPDPGQTSEGPRTERWWDGGAWTAQTRAATAPAPGAPGPQYQSAAVPYGYPYPPPPGPRRGLRVGVAVGVAVVVLACIGGGVYALGTGSGGGDHRAGRPHPAGSETAPAPDERDGDRGDGDGGAPEEPGAPEPSVPTEDGYATDLASGISLPVPDGWKGKSGTVGAGVITGSYTCPGGGDDKCVLGGVFSVPAQALKLKQTGAEAAARADIGPNARSSYGGETYGKIASHKVLAEKKVRVAGGDGYLVRWRVNTQRGDDGYVQSLAFPSPLRKGMLVVVRFGFDVNAKAPKLPVMDEITEGIKKAPAGAGNGRNV
ncbi:DUF2510 domain-containing protein [Streptomyces sp. NPDC058045]|uniref:DUF2510 domain-containing protein n=1 Tax=Streptomyces sp. NPDC058045 TaxID=3346311 RepID=UPI0036E981A6